MVGNGLYSCPYNRSGHYLTVLNDLFKFVSNVATSLEGLG